MKRKIPNDPITVEQFGHLSIKFFRSWWPERFADKDSPLYRDARALRLEADRIKKSMRKPRKP